jgi:5'-nucleotidase
MRILVTNDDGIGAAGLDALVRALEPANEVWVIAPDSQRSGVSHAITLHQPGKIRKTGERRFSCSGTPVDCIILAGLGAIPFRPELVIAGINEGPNLGTDIIFSGTCGAARQAALGGIPGIAVSCANYVAPFLYDAAAYFVADNLAKLVESCQAGTFLNINAPSSAERPLAAEWVSPGKNRYMDRLISFEAPDGYSYHFLAGGKHEVCEEDFCDHPTIASGRISISPILVNPQSPRGFVAGRQF